MASVRLHVQDSGGQGRPIILIHGWPLSGESWKAQIPALTGAGFRVIAYDRRGFGRSDKPADGFDYDTLADDLAGLIDIARRSAHLPHVILLSSGGAVYGPPASAPSSIPAGTFRAMVCLRRSVPVPLHTVQTFSGTLPRPLQVSQVTACWIAPNMVFMTRVCWPAPWQVGQVFSS